MLETTEAFLEAAVDRSQIGSGLAGRPLGAERPRGTPLYRSRAPLEEIRRNIRAAGFEAIERDPRFSFVG